VLTVRWQKADSGLPHAAIPEVAKIARSIAAEAELRQINDQLEAR
jgi:hypothetical protein